jgi:FeS assembly SUF system protein
MRDAGVAHFARGVERRCRPGFDGMSENLKNRIIEALRTVYDPEIPVNIYELGLVYEINIDEAANVAVKMTLTAPNCPVAGSLPGEVERKVRGVPGVKDVTVELVFDPPWDRGRMSESALIQLGMF